MSIDITIQSADNVLRGKMHPAQGAGPFVTLLLLHGSPGNEIDVLGLGEKLSAHAINVLTFNYSGTHQSDGLWGFEATQRDIHAAYTLLNQPETVERFNIDTSRLVLGGYSYGGGMALTYAASHPAISAVFSIAGTDHGAFMREYVGDAEYRAMVDGIFDRFKQLDSPLRPAPGESPKEALAQDFDFSPYDLRLSAPALANRQILLIGGWDDPNVTIENHMLPLYRALKAEQAAQVTMWAYQDDHAFANVRDDLANYLLAWIESLAHPLNIA